VKEKHFFGSSEERGRRGIKLSRKTGIRRKFETDKEAANWAYLIKFYSFKISVRMLRIMTLNMMAFGMMLSIMTQTVEIRNIMTQAIVIL
jgi:hypothetical protein